MQWHSFWQPRGQASFLFFITFFGLVNSTWILKRLLLKESINWENPHSSGAELSKVWFSYQSLSGSMWCKHLERTNNKMRVLTQFRKLKAYQRRMLRDSQHFILTASRDSRKQMHNKSRVLSSTKTNSMRRRVETLKSKLCKLMTKILIHAFGHSL